MALSGYTLSSTITGSSAPVLSISDPSKAPYGLKAEKALNCLNPIYSSGTPLPGTVPAWIKPLATYANVTKAFSAVGTDVPVGFAAESQICTHINPFDDGELAWVQFTSADTTYGFILQQYAVFLKTSDTVGSAINSDIATKRTYPTGATWWNNFLGNWCYNTI